MLFAQRPAFAGSCSHLRPALLATTALLCLLAASPAARAQAIIDGGMTVNVPGDQASPWNVGGSLQVGRFTTGTLNIGATGIVNNTNGFVGSQAGSNGVATVDGVWNNSAILEIGQGGTGHLTIQNGGKVFDANANIGDNGNGTAIITGAGSRWTSSNGFIVGATATGTVNILNGGAVASAAGIVGLNAGGSGTVTVDGAGSSWTNSSILTVGQFGLGVVTISQGGVLSNTVGALGVIASGNGTIRVTGAGSRWTNSADVTIGDAGTGAVILETGGAITDTSVILGKQVGSHGTATINGAANWTSTAGMSVGKAGTGTLAISGGGQVSNGVAYLGELAGGDGTVTVDGAGSTWTNTANLIVGYAATGKGKLIISSGGSVTSAPTVGSDISAIGHDGTGSVIVTGIGSTWTANALAVGNLNAGDLTIADGGLVTSTGLNIGSSNGATGLVHVMGLGSLLNLTLNATSTLNVGAHGTGTLTIDSGGRVADTDIIQLGKSADGIGTINVSGANSRLETGSAFVVGLAGTGTVTIAAGGTVTSATGSVGGNQGSHGNVTVTGAGSSWTNAGGLTIASVGTGQLSILGGGVVTSATMAGSFSTVGGTFNSAGTVSVSGAGSTWNANSLVVGDLGDFAIAGDGGSGALNIVLGGRVNSTDAIVAIGNGSQGQVAVSGAGSLWSNSNELTIGGGFGASGIPSSGSLVVTDGGRVSTTGDAYIARATEAIAAADISGAGSSLTVGGGLTVGSPNGGNGTLNVSDGGSVIVAGVLGIAPGPGAIGVLNIGGVMGDAAKGAGSVQAGSVLLNGILNFNHTGTGYVFASDISGTGTILQAAGVTALTGDSSAFTGTATISGGKLAVNGTLGGVLDIGAATLQGTGKVGTTVIGNGGILAPGNSIGTLTVNGDLTLAAGTITNIEVDPTSADKVVVTGTANLAGTLAASFAVGPYVQRQYTLLSAAMVNGTFATFTTTAPVGYLASLAYDSGHVYLNLTSNSFIWSATPASGDWNTGANWKNGLVPSATDSAEFAATANSTITVSQATAVNGIQIDSGAPVYNFAITGSGAGAASLTLNSGITDLAANAPAITASGVAGNTGTLAFTGTGNAADARLTAGAFGTVSFTGTTDAGAAATLTALAGGTIDLSGTTGALGSGKVNAGSIAGAGNFLLGANALTVGARNTSTTVSGVISGTGNLTKLGTGTLTLTGINTLTGATTVAAGRLAVNGALAGLVVTVQSGASLGGTGTVKGVIAQSGALIGPGNSIGTLTVAGNYAQASGSTYNVELATTGASDRINVAGIATITNGAVLNVTRTDAGQYVLGTHYTVLTAAGGVNGTYALSGDLVTASYGLAARYDANNVYLDVYRAKAFADFGTTANQFAAGVALDTLPGTGALTTPLANLLSNGAVAAALDQISGEIHATLLSAAFEDARAVRDTMLERMRKRGASGWSLWGNVQGAWGNMDGDGNAGAASRSATNLTMGVDTALGANWRLGVEGGYTRAHLNIASRASAAAASGGQVGAYAVGRYDAISLRTGVSYGSGTSDTSRGIVFGGFSEPATASQGLDTLQVFGEAGYGFDLRGIQLEPFAGLAWTQLEAGGFIETGGAAALAGAARQMDDGFFTLGVNFAPRQGLDMLGGVMTPNLRIGWQRAFNGDLASRSLSFAGSQPFTVLGVPLDRDRTVIDAGATLALRGARVSLGYGGSISSHGTEHGVKLGLAMDW